MIVRIRLMSALLLGALAAPAAAQDHRSARWGQAGGWQIHVDRAAGNGCFATRRYDDGTGLRIGVNPKEGGFHFMIANSTWRPLETGKIYRVTVVFDDQKNYEGELEAIAVQGTTVLLNPDVGAEFASDFMARTSLRIYYRRSQIASLSLNDTHAALTQVMTCQKEMWAAGNSSEPRVRPASDPFSR